MNAVRAAAGRRIAGVDALAPAYFLTRWFARFKRCRRDPAWLRHD